jgi:hypothetical protein
VSDTDNRCGTCRYYEPRKTAVCVSGFGYCDWVAGHIVGIKIPYWIEHKASRPLTHADTKRCDAWEQKP